MSTQKERFEEYRKGFLEGVRINKIDVLKLIDEFKDKILNANTKSRNYIEIVDFKYQIQELIARIEGEK